MRALYMAVDLEKNELPLFVSMSVQEVADWAGTSKESVMSSIVHAKERGAPCRFKRIYLDEDDDLLKEERTGKLIGTEEISKRIGVAATTFKRHKDEIPVRKWLGVLVAEEAELDEWLANPPEWLMNCWKKKEERSGKRTADG